MSLIFRLALLLTIMIGTQWRVSDSQGRGSNLTRGCCVPTTTQHAIPPGSDNEYQRKLGSKRTYHVMQWPCIRGVAS